MNRLFKASAFLLLSLTAVGCQNKEPTLEEHIYDVYSKGRFVGSYKAHYKDNPRLSYTTYYSIRLEEGSTPENMTFAVSASYSRRQPSEDEVKHLYKYEAKVSFLYHYGETITQNGKHSEDFESGKGLYADYETHYKSTFAADVGTDGSLENINITSFEKSDPELTDEYVSDKCKEEIRNLFAEFRYSGYVKWCEKNSVANIFDPIGNAANSSKSGK